MCGHSCCKCHQNENIEMNLSLWPYESIIQILRAVFVAECWASHWIWIHVYSLDNLSYAACDAILTCLLSWVDRGCNLLEVTNQNLWHNTCDPIFFSCPSVEGSGHVQSLGVFMTLLNLYILSSTNQRRKRTNENALILAFKCRILYEFELQISAEGDVRGISAPLTGLRPTPLPLSPILHNSVDVKLLTACKEYILLVFVVLLVFEMSLMDHINYPWGLN